MIDYLLSLSLQPAWIFMVIILASYVLEDVAIILAAVMAADQMIAVPLAFCAILSGIVSGDIALYIIGRQLADNRRFRLWLQKKNRQQHYESLLGGNLFKNILLIRFIPGLRFACYTGCGLLRLNLVHFVAAVAAAAIMWVTFVFFLIYQLGTSVWLEYGDSKWLLVPLALVLLLISNRQLMRRMQQPGML